MTKKDEMDKISLYQERNRMEQKRTEENRREKRGERESISSREEGKLIVI